MRRPFIGFSNPRYLFRAYFVRKKWPLGHLWWHNILGREVEFEGMYNTALAAADYEDCGIELRRGAWGENRIDLVIYSPDNEIVGTVPIQLSYRSMSRVMDGFTKARRMSQRVIRTHNENEADPKADGDGRA